MRNAGKRRSRWMSPTCATTAPPIRWPRSSRCSTTCSARRRATAARSWRSPTPPGSCCGCAVRPETLRQAEKIGFVEGSNWDERLAGTNAPGLALRLGQPIQVRRAEHFRHSVQQWSCAATPIHDPTSSSLLGVLDITGGDDIVVPQTMAMVRAAARMAEAELARDLPHPRRRSRSSPTPGCSSCSSCSAATRRCSRHRRPRQLASASRRRHSEILLLLGVRPAGALRRRARRPALRGRRRLLHPARRAQPAAPPARRRPPRLAPLPATAPG